MANSAKAVANNFLTRGFDEGIDLSPMKLQKLVYYAHGWHLGYIEEPLIDEQVECWRFGPVVPSLFHEFKEFGKKPVDRLATTIKCEGKRWKFTQPALEVETITITLLENVWDAYKGFSAVRLSNMTHANGEPWHTIYHENNKCPPKGTDIPTALIQSHFQSLIPS